MRNAIDKDDIKCKVNEEGDDIQLLIAEKRKGKFTILTMDAPVITCTIS